MNEIEEDPGIQLRAHEPLIGDVAQPQLLDDTFVRSAPNLGESESGARLLEEDVARPAERPPLLRSAMKGGRRRFLADAEERTKAIAADSLREQGKQREPKSKELKKARKLMVDEVQGGKDALRRAAIPQERRQFNRVGFASQESRMDFDLTDAPQEISAQMESDKNVWKERRGGAMGSNLLFESRAPLKTEDEQQDVARKDAFNSDTRSTATLSANTKKLMSSLWELHTSNPEEAKKNAFYVDNNKRNPFKHTVGAINKDAKSIDAALNRPGLDRKTREGLMQRAQIVGSSDTNNTDATEHARAQGQTRAYSTRDRANVARFANNRGNAASRFLSGIGDFFAKIMPGAGRLFGASRDTRFEAAPGQREARDLLGQEQDTFRRNARSGKLGFMRMFFGRTSGAGRSRLPIGPRPAERAPTREEYADEQRAMAAEPAAVKSSLLEAPALAPAQAIPAVGHGVDESLDAEEIKQPAEQLDDQLLEQSSMDGLLGHDDE